MNHFNSKLPRDPSRLVVPDDASVALIDLITGASYGSIWSVVTYSVALPEFGIALLKLTIKP